MGVVKYFPAKEQATLVAALKKSERDYLSAKIVKENADGTVDLVVNVPDGLNELVQNVKSESYEAVGSHKVAAVASEAKSAKVRKPRAKKTDVVTE